MTVKCFPVTEGRMKDILLCWWMKMKYFLLRMCFVFLIIPAVDVYFFNKRKKANCVIYPVLTKLEITQIWLEKTKKTVLGCLGRLGDTTTITTTNLSRFAPAVHSNYTAVDWLPAPMQASSRQEVVYLQQVRAPPRKGAWVQIIQFWTYPPTLKGTFKNTTQEIQMNVSSII